MSTQADTSRSNLLDRALLLEYGSLGYNVLEAVAGVLFGLAASSVALIGFGLDSIVEASSAGILVWRLRAERHGGRASEDLERRAVRLVACAFLSLGAYVGVRSVIDLVTEARPEESVPGIVLAIASLIIMPWLAMKKRSAARALNSRSLEADSKQTLLCTYLSGFLLVGLAANALFGWWWADPLAGMAIAILAVREGLALWRLEDFCCP
jgi:divalent metal cation (Fe/Co/Zn/Cd) transporter